MHVLVTVLIASIGLMWQQPGTSAKFNRAIPVGEKVTATVAAGSVRSRDAFGSVEKQVVVVDLHFDAKDFTGLKIELSSDPNNELNIVLSIGAVTLAPAALAIYDPDKPERPQIFRRAEWATGTFNIALVFGGERFSGKRVVSLLFELSETPSVTKTLRLGFKVDQKPQVFSVLLP